ncbi:MAG: hypothetical protein H7145_04920 [Akkermansiaceae bacterium]|nr:hypothetical protein [Armatimonadota bacterium]
MSVGTVDTMARADGATNSGRELNRVQIFKQVTKDRLLDVGDMLSLDARRNKISISLVAFDEDYHATTRVRHYVDVADAKLVCYDILNGFFTEWADHKGSAARGGGVSGGEGNAEGLQARVLTIRKDPKYRQPYVIKVDNGVGEQLPGGAVKMAEMTDSLTMLLSEWDARKMALTIMDYIRDWETINFRKRQEAQTQIIPLPGAEVGSGSGDGDAVATPALSKNRYARAAAN